MSTYGEHSTTDFSVGGRAPPLGNSVQPDLSIPARVVLSVRSSTTPGVVPDNALVREFKRLAGKWQRETRHLSSPVDRYLHPSYARIIGLGPASLGIILRDLRENQNDWFYALRAITGANPVTAAMAGDVARMTDAWVRWGQKRGIIDGVAT